jgi:hypothetical protein
MSRKNRDKRQLNLEELLTAALRWSELPKEVRAEVVELVEQMLREHAAYRAREAADE